MNRIIFSLIAICSFFSLNAQDGFIRGTVIEDESGLTVIGATVLVNELGTGAVTDFDGAFSIPIEDGTYSVTVSYVGFQDVKIQEVEVKGGNVNYLGELRMSDESLQLNEVVISAKAVRTTEAAIVTIKKKSPAMLDGISSSLMKLTGDASAVDAAKRVTGVSIEGGKYVYVRGLGDRYSKTTLNGVDIPGLDPDRNTIQMDIFPTALLNNLIVSKNFTAEMPADFTGGLINIETKDFPEEKLVSASVSVGYNPAMNFNDQFLTYQGGKTDFLGFDDGTRALPAGAYQSQIPIALNPNFTSDEVNTFVNGFNPTLGTSTTTSLMDYSASFSMGNQVKLGADNTSTDKGTLGYMVSLSYRNDYTYYGDYYNGEFQRYAESDAYDLRYANIQEGQVAEQNTILGGLAVLAYKRKLSKFRLTAMRLQNGENRAGQFMIDNSGEAVGQSGYLGQRDNIEYNQRSLTNVMLNGIHKIGTTGWEIDWRVSPTLSTSDDPDIRVAGLSIGGPKGYQVNPGEVGAPSRLWRSLREASLVGKLDISKAYQFKGADARFKFGLSQTLKERDYEILSYNMSFLGGQLQFEEYDLNVFMAPENIYPGNLNVYYQSGNRLPINPNQYNATISNSAFYVSNEMELLKDVKVILGLRGENFVQRHTGRDIEFANGGDGNNLENEKVLDAFDLFPSANLIYALTGNMNFRVAYSKTIARPSFKELSFAQIIDPLSNRIFNGSLFQYSDWGGQLVETRIDNFDVRWEFFQNRGQMISVSAFMKQFENPIELVRIPEAQTTSEFQPRNVGNGQVVGFEFEVRKNLKFIHPTLENLSINTNLTIVESRIDMTSTEYNSRKNFERAGETVDNVRAMAGQSPCVINAGLVYNNPDRGLDAGLFYNVKGRTLEIVSSGLYPDVYLNPFNSLNFSFKKSFGKDMNSSISFKAANILNDDMERVFSSFNAADEYFTKFSPGISFSLGYSHQF